MHRVAAHRAHCDRSSGEYPPGTGAEVPRERNMTADEAHREKVLLFHAHRLTDEEQKGYLAGVVRDEVELKFEVVAEKRRGR